MNKKQQKPSILQKLTPSDYLSVLCGIAGFVAAAYASLNVDTIAIGLIFALMSYALVIIAWIYVMFIRWQNEKLIEHKEKEIDQIKNEKEEIIDDLKIQVSALPKKRDLIIKQLSHIATAVKSHNIHNNNSLIKILNEGDEQYDYLSEFYNNPFDKKRTAEEIGEAVKDKMQKSAQHHADALFDLFNSYCRESTEETKKLLNAYLIIKDMPRQVSVSIKLLDKPLTKYKNNCRHDDVHVYTAFRDNDTYTENKREIGRKLYKISKNSDYLQCLEKHEFIVNNLSQDEKNYMNENDAYYLHYDCTVVVPIRIKYPNGELKFFGFLCCDCKNDDKRVEVFDKICAQYLFAFAQNVATFLETLDNNLADRFEMLPTNVDNVLSLLYIKIYKGDASSMEAGSYGTT